MGRVFFFKQVPTKISIYKHNTNSQIITSRGEIFLATKSAMPTGLQKIMKQEKLSVIYLSLSLHRQPSFQNTCRSWKESAIHSECV